MSTVVRWNPVRELATMQSAMDRILENTWNEGRSTWNGGRLAVDAYENDHAYTVMANLPGVNPDDIRINLHDGVLTVEVDIPEPASNENSRTLIQERFFGKLSRQFTIPNPVNIDEIEANYDAGVLTLVLPKSPEAQPRHIPVRANGVRNN